jgi:hypothetical protein
VKSLEQNTSNVLLDEDVNKLDFIRTTPFPADQWENYFDVTGRGYVGLKKRVRIAVALTLIKDGFLNTYSVEALSKEIGYKSRTSFTAVLRKSPEVNFQNSVRRCASRKTSKKPALSGRFLPATHPFLKI